MEEEKKMANNAFFRLSPYTEQINEDEYTRIQPAIDTLDALSLLCSTNIYIIDYYKKTFLYISPRHLFLQGITAEEFKKMGFLFFKKFTPPEDYEFLLHIKQEGFRFYNDIPVEHKLKYTLSYNFHVVFDKKKILVNQRITPFKLNSRHEIWLSMCVVTLASKDSLSEIEIKNSETSERLLYHKPTGKWQACTSIRLSEKEAVILRLSAQGLNNQEIASYMCLNVNTIKFHKKNIFAKLSVSNIQEAITYAINNRLI